MHDAVIISGALVGARELVTQYGQDASAYQGRSDLSFGQVANLLSYDSQAAFSRAFRRWHGLTPREARKPPADSSQA